MIGCPIDGSVAPPAGGLYAEKADVPFPLLASVHDPLQGRCGDRLLLRVVGVGGVAAKTLIGGDPEVKLPQAFAQLTTEHFREPVVGRGEDSKDRRNTHDQVKVAHYEIRVVKIDIRGGLIQEQAAQASAHEQGNETDGEKHGRVEADLPAPQSPQPVEGLERLRRLSGQDRTLDD